MFKSIVEVSKRVAPVAVLAALVLVSGCVTKPKSTIKPEMFAAFALPDSNRNEPTYHHLITRDSLVSPTFCNVMNPGHATGLSVVYFGLPT